MKKKLCTFAILSVLSTIILIACSKIIDDSKQVSLPSSSMNGNALTSYSGESFIYNPNYANEYENVGIYHNYIMDCVSHEWLNDEFETATTDFFEFVVSKIQQIDGFSTGINYDTIISDIRNDFLQSSFDELTNDEQRVLIESLLTGGDYESFLKDIDENINNSADTIELLKKFDIIAQKVYNSSYPDEVKDRYLIYCVVSKYSVMNLVHICMDTNSGFYKYLVSSAFDSKESLINKVKHIIKKHPVAASDAVGAVIGGVTCAKYGAAGGPAGVAITAIAGAVVRGACSSSMSAAGREILNR